ncbi:hypothetical protein BIW11_02875 [Tropilaelaps mercedesae]|uniref:Uncharacterized protein n=1 Tax=Tropilaelaps mercedesae TaxID=418985 RepID=A0A1V9XWD0_9ACAR|nr:hypothetical protein BIW11_02875 [Tropilaelaps mercedesae]
MLPASKRKTGRVLLGTNNPKEAAWLLPVAVKATSCQLIVVGLMQQKNENKKKGLLLAHDR